jgi:putative ABC transport system permease protein
MTGLWQDISYGLRIIRKSPGFSAVAILTLALGIGATAAICSVIEGVLLNPFPYKNANRLATPSILFPDQVTITKFPVPVFLDFKEQNRTFEDVIGLAYTSVHLRGSGETEEFSGGWVTPNTFDFLGIEPILGRRITQQDGKPGSPPVFVMSYTLWSKLFHRDPKILGATLTLNGTPRTLVAIMPPRFRFGDCEVWLPLELNPSTFITGFGLQPNELWMVGRLKSGVSLQAASADLGVVAKRLEKM